MGMRELRISYPEELLERLGEAPEVFEQELRFLVSAKLYELGKLSSGQAANLAGMERVAFLEELGRYHISVLNYPVESLESEIRDALERADKAS